MAKRLEPTGAPRRIAPFTRAIGPGCGGAGIGRVFALALFLGLFLAASSTHAQVQIFGKNKVQYSGFRWRVMESPHFRLYFYDEEATLASEASMLAEESYRVLRARFVHEVTRPIPLIVYSSHQDFEQTNVTPIFLPEGIAGMTEYAKGRVLIPFDGSLRNFRVTIQHELVHVFQLSLTDRVFRAHFRNSPLAPPLWFTEGLAVHWSEERDSEADMVLRDMVLSGRLPDIAGFWRYEGGYVVYKLGQSVLDYLGAHYGEDRIRLLYERLWAFDRFEDVLREVLGISQEELSERWAHDLKRRYYPEVEQAAPASLVSRALTRPGGADFKPLPLPASLAGYGHHFAFLSPRNGYTNIYTASDRLEEVPVGEDKPREKELKTLLAGERRPEFESFHAFRSRMDISTNGVLLFVSKHEGHDEIVLYSVLQRRVLERHDFADLVALSSPSWVQGEESFVFSGLAKDGQSDLYLFDRRSRSLTRLLDDRYQDLDPTYCAWCDAIVWSSDRTPGGDAGARNLFLLDLRTRRIRALTRGSWRDLTPVADASRRQIFFVSDRDGMVNVCSVDETGKGRTWTRCLDGIMDPRIPAGEDRFLATVYHDGAFQVRSFPLPDSGGTAIALAPADTAASWSWPAPPLAAATRIARYKPRFSLDMAQGGALLDPGMRTGEGLLAAFSDMMGDHLIYVGLGNATFSTNDFLRSLSLAVTYVNLSHRLNYGLSAYHYAGDYYDELGYPFFERRAGAGLLLRYPLNKYERLETDLNLAYTETDNPARDIERNGPVGTQSLSYVKDTSLWLTTGPIDGQRLNLTVGRTTSLQSGANENTVLLGDWRRYLRLGLYSAYAVRLQGRWSEGTYPEIFLLGGSYSLRGWLRGSLYGTRSLLVNQELRFPLLRGVLLGLPLGDVELPGVEGAFFLDVGSAWSKDVDGREQGPAPWMGAYGFGFRMGFGGYLVFRLETGWPTDFHHVGRSGVTEFSIGWDF